MANFFEQFHDEPVAAKVPEAGAPAPPATSGGNFFEQFDTGVTLNVDEQEVVGATFSKTKETPESFGLAKLPDDIVKFLVSGPAQLFRAREEATAAGKGFGAGVATLPRIPASLLIQAGEGAEQAGAPGSVPPLIANAGRAMIEQNDAAIAALGFKPREGFDFSYDVGNGLSQLAIQLGSYYYTKSLKLGMAYIFGRIESEDYLEARKADKPPDEAFQIAVASAGGQAVLEGAGTAIWASAIHASTPIRKTAIRVAEQFTEESTQALWEETIKGVSGVRDTPMEEKIWNVIYQGVLGAVVSAPVAVTQAHMEATAKAEGLDLPSGVIDSVMDNIERGKDDILDAVTAQLDKESTGLGTDPKVTEELVRRKKEAIAAKEAELSAQEGETAPAAKPPVRERTIAERAAPAPTIEESIQAVVTEGIEGIPQNVAEAVGKKLIAGQELTPAELAVGQDIVAQAEVRKAQLEGATPEAIQQQQQAKQQAELTDLRNQVDTTVLAAGTEIAATIEGIPNLSPKTRQLLEDRAALLKERGRSDNVADDIRLIDKALDDINKELVNEPDADLARQQINDLQDSLAELQRAERQIRTRAKRAGKAATKFEAVRQAATAEVIAEQGVADKLPKAKREDHKQQYVEVIAADRGLKGKLSDALSDSADALKLGLERVLTPIGSRVTRINPKIGAQFAKFEAEGLVTIAEYGRRTKPFFDGFKKLSREDKMMMDLAMKNRWQDDVMAIARRNNMEEAVVELRKVLDEVYATADKLGIDLGYLRDYYPRMVKNPAKFLEYLSKHDGASAFQQALEAVKERKGRYLTEEEKVEVVRRLLMGQFVDGVRLKFSGNLKNRSLDEVNAEFARFYSPTPNAISHYLTDVVATIQQRKFFGKQLEDAPDTLQETMAAYTLREVEKGNITPQQEQRLLEIFKARFNQESMNPILRLYKNSEYILVMGQIKSAITQIGDVYTSLYKNGFYRTGAAITDFATGKDSLSMKDLGINAIAQEFSHDSISSRAVDLVFTANFLKAVDGFGKRTFINSTLKRYQDLAKKPSAAFKANIEMIFEDEAGQVMEDLRNGEASHNVKVLLATELMKVQPITLSQMPEMYLKNPNGRVFYMLKTFTVRHLDFVRTEVIDQYKTDPIQAGQNLVRLAILFTALGATADELKDWLFNRVSSWSDTFIDNMLKFAGASKFQVDQARRQGLGETLKNSVFPPTKTPTDVRSIPVVGDIYYWWFGKGAEKTEKEEKKKQGKVNSLGKPL